MMKQRCFIFLLLISAAWGLRLAGQGNSGKRPLYYIRIITRGDLNGRTLRELWPMRNTIYARAGNTSGG